MPSPEGSERTRPPNWHPDGAQGDPGQAWQGSASYTVAFDANPPADCSSTPVNNLQDVTLPYGQTGTAPDVEEGKLVLKGYELASWNTNADGTGTEIEPKGEFKNLTAENGGKVTLYAQWVPYQYVIMFEGFGPEGPQTTSQTLAFDQPGTLKSIGEPGFVSRAENGSFLGWNSGHDNGLYPDQAHVINLCGFLSNGSSKPSGYKLTPQWIASDDRAYVTVMDNHENGRVTPVQDLADKLSLSKDGTSSGHFAEVSEHPGVYAIDRNGLSEGTYDVKLEGYDATGKTVTIEANKAAMVALNYCTVKTAIRII